VSRDRESASHGVASIGIRLLACAIVNWLAWRWKGPHGLVFSAPL
jgi:hypothetical protein